MLRPSIKKKEKKPRGSGWKVRFPVYVENFFLPTVSVGRSATVPPLPYNFAKWNKSSKRGGGVCTVS